MTNVQVEYEVKVVTAVRGFEGKSVAKWEKDGWELVSQTPATLSTTLFFRRQKKHSPKWVWAAAVAAVVFVGVGIAVASTLEQGEETAQTASTPVATGSPTPRPSPVVTAKPSATPTPATDAPVSDAEVVGAFQDFFTERASANVLYGKAVTGVTFEGGVVRVTFDAAAAGVDQATFDSFAADFNFPNFAASAIAFKDTVGNRVRPIVDSIETVRTDGSSLGTLDHAGILALNGLSE